MKRIEIKIPTGYTNTIVLWSFLSFCVLFNSVSFAQENAPVAVNDSSHIVVDIYNSQTYEFNVLLNDYDPDGDEINIIEVDLVGSIDTILFTDSTIIYDFGGSPSKLYEYDFIYRISKVNSPSSISNPAKLTVNPAMSTSAPIAKNDTVFISPLQDLYVNVLRNDYDSNGDSIILSSAFGNGQVIGDSIVYVPFRSDNKPEDFYRDYFNGYKTITYTIKDTNILLESYDRGLLHIIFDPIEFYDSLDINNVNAMFNCFGHHFWDMSGGVGARFKVPNGTWQTSLFNNTLWIGGLDENENLHLAAEKYRQVGADYWHGPISTVYDSVYDQKWFKIWKLTKEEIEYHKSHWWENDYDPITDILTWPGNGDTEMGQMQKMAPFYDANGNDQYEPMDGDYPVIKGDQSLFFVFNDARKNHSESHYGLPLGIEIHAMAYAFDTPEDSTLWSTVFLHYDIYNRSDTSYYDCYIGSYTETDLGYPWDDRIQSDVQNGMYFTYNGLETDQIEFGEVQKGYGEHPPAQGVVFLGGPFKDADGLDNPKYDIIGNQICDESINGLYFGDTIVDNERLGMNSFLSFSGNWPLDYPGEPIEYYQYMKSLIEDSLHLQYGGYGFPSSSVGPDCRFMFPKDSDSCNWGTNGIQPNGGFNQNGYYWDEESTGGMEGNRTGMGATGPFTFESGDAEQLNLAFVWARDYNGTAWSSAELLKERVSYLRQKFEFDYDFFSDIPIKKIVTNDIIAFPNPVSNLLTIKFQDLIKEGTCSIYNSIGIVKGQGHIYDQREVKYTTSNLQTGLHILRINIGSEIYTLKFLKN